MSEDAQILQELRARGGDLDCRPCRVSAPEPCPAHREREPVPDDAAPDAPSADPTAFERDAGTPPPEPDQGSENGSPPSPAADGKAEQVAPPQAFTGAVVPHGYRVAANPEYGLIALVLDFPGGSITVQLEAGEETDQLASFLHSANAKAKSGIVPATMADMPPAAAEALLRKQQRGSR